MINLNVAGAVVHYDSFIKKLPIIKLMNKNIQFNVYEGPNLCQWNGGRINSNIELTEEIINQYNKFGISISLTFTNPVIDLTDKIGLNLLKMLDKSQKKHNIKNKIVLINEEFRQFLRKNYNFSLIYSITGHPSSVILTNDVIEYYKDLETKFDYIVPKFEFVFEPDFYNKIQISKYELLINDTCLYGCPYYFEHFREIAKQNEISTNPLEEIGKDICSKISECWLPNFDPNVGSEANRRQHKEKLGMDFTRDMIRKSQELGYSSFKISGRENPTELIVQEVQRFCKDINER